MAKHIHVFMKDKKVVVGKGKDADEEVRYKNFIIRKNRPDTSGRFYVHYTDGRRTSMGGFPSVEAAKKIIDNDGALDSKSKDAEPTHAKVLRAYTTKSGDKIPAGTYKYKYQSGEPLVEVNGKWVDVGGWSNVELVTDSKSKDATNHLGEKEYTSFNGWKVACRAANPSVQFEGDKEICQAKPGVGEWDGERGSVYGTEKAKDSQKPYVSSDANGHHVINGSGKIVASWSKTPEGMKEAQHYLSIHFDALTKDEDTAALKKRLAVLEAKMDAFAPTAPLREKAAVAEEIKELRKKISETKDGESKADILKRASDLEKQADLLHAEGTKFLESILQRSDPRIKRAEIIYEEVRELKRKAASMSS